VIPRGFRGGSWDATPGDIGVVLSRSSGRLASFVVGDVGGALDEGSARLLADLQGIDRLPASRKMRALGQPGKGIGNRLSGDFRMAIFRHSAPLLPPELRGGLSVLSKSADELGQWIAETARDRLQAIGGQARLISCTDPN